MSAARVTIPNNVRMMIQNIKEITVVVVMVRMLEKVNGGCNGDVKGCEGERMVLAGNQKCLLLLLLLLTKSGCEWKKWWHSIDEEDGCSNGFNFFNPYAGQSLAGVLSTRIQSLEVKIETKTKVC